MIPYACCPGCRHVTAFDGDMLRDAIPTAFLFADMIGGLPDVEWFPREWLEIAEGAVEDHEQVCPARS